jgi:hypothetical protein
MTETSGWLLAALFPVALISVVVLLQDRFIYFPSRYSPADLREAKNIGVQELRFMTSQGSQAAFFWRSNDSETAPQNVWIVFGGNGDVALNWIDLVHDFPGPHTGYLLVDYPGYGICEGRPNPDSILESSENALQTSSGTETLATWGMRPGCPGTLTRRGGRSPICRETCGPQNSGGFYFHYHGRYGSRTDPHPFGATPPASVR